MRTTLAAFALILFSGSSTMAVEYRTPVTKQLFTCAAESVSRVVAQAMSAPCCDGQLKCAQFLSTTGVLKSIRDPRT